MVDQTKVAAAVQEVKELKELFEKIKEDSEELFARSKALSETGVHEAQDLIEAARSNWDQVIKNFSTSGGLSKLISAAFKVTKSATKKKTVSSAKKAIPAKASKGSKKTSAKKGKKARK